MMALICDLYQYIHYYYVIQIHIVRKYHRYNKLQINFINIHYIAIQKNNPKNKNIDY